MWPRQRRREMGAANFSSGGTADGRTGSFFTETFLHGGFGVGAGETLEEQQPHQQCHFLRRTRNYASFRSLPHPEFLALKQESRILAHSSNPVCGFSIMEQVRLCTRVGEDRQKINLDQRSRSNI